MRIKAAVAAAAAALTVGALTGCTPAPTHGGNPGAPPVPVQRDVTTCLTRPTANGPDKPVATPPSAAPTAGKILMTITTSEGAIEIELDRAKTPCTAAFLSHLATQSYFDGSKCHRMTNEGIWVIQCGDPKGDGTGGPGFEYNEENQPALPVRPGQPLPTYCATLGSRPVPTDTPVIAPEDILKLLADKGLCRTEGDEANRPAMVYRRGTVAMARTQVPGTTGSQFFFSYKDNELPGDYTPFGTVVKGMDILDRVAAAGIVGGESDGPLALPLVIQKVSVAAGR
jgi:peptidyl-prolyl cis-trans isomerase B (cyclophilin B)